MVRRDVLQALVVSHGDVTCCSYVQSLPVAAFAAKAMQKKAELAEKKALLEKIKSEKAGRSATPASEPSESKGDSKADAKARPHPESKAASAALLGQRLMSDVTFVLTGEDGKTEEMPGHRLILGVASPVFQKLLFADGKQTVPFDVSA